MARNVPSSLSDIVSQPVIAPILFIEADFDSYSLRMWSGLGDLYWDNKTWVGGGSMLSVAAIEESNEVKAVGTRVSLSGIPSELISMALQEDYQGRPLKVYLGAFTTEANFLAKEDGTLVLKEDAGSITVTTKDDIVTDPLIIFSGRMDVMTIAEGGDTSTIEITVENRLIDFERTRERRYTAEDQKIDYPNDKGFDFVASIQNVQITWGRV